MYKMPSAFSVKLSTEIQFCLQYFQELDQLEEQSHKRTESDRKSKSNNNKHVYVIVIKENN
jgi:hypothetical protein